MNISSNLDDKVNNPKSKNNSNIKSIKNIITCSLMLLLAYETTNKLNTKQDELKLIKWSDGEANLDSEFSSLARKCCNDSWINLKTNNSYLKEINLVTSAPDIECYFTNANNEFIKYKIELKSSKNISMVGSTIANLDINMPLIYCHRPKSNVEKFEIKCCQYYRAIGSSDFERFQDRTPRPIINFDKMPIDKEKSCKYKHKEKNEWINYYGDCAINRINNQINDSWQDDLIKYIRDHTIDNFIKNSSTEEFFIKLKNLFNQK